MPTAYYFTSMIITGCLAVVSDVIESYCHHKPTSSNVPSWLCKLARKRQGQKHKDTAKCGHHGKMAASDYAREANTDIIDVPEKRMQIYVTEDSSRESLSVNMETEVTWKELASAINQSGPIAQIGNITQMGNVMPNWATWILKTLPNSATLTVFLWWKLYL